MPLGFGRAVSVYDTLAQTPFVGLYSTASEHEDLAELVAWHEVVKQHHGELVIEVKDVGGKTLGLWRPLTFPKVLDRFSEVETLLAAQTACVGLS